MIQHLPGLKVYRGIALKGGLHGKCYRGRQDLMLKRPSARE